MSVNSSGVITHSAGEIPETQSEAGTIEIAIEGSRHQRLEFPDAGVLASRVSIVLPGRMSRAHYSRRNRGQALIDHQLAKWCTPACFPIRVVSARIVDQLLHLAP